jgi:hypothetical protein
MIQAFLGGSPHMKIKTLTLFALPILVSACAVSRVDPMTVPLSYTADTRNDAAVGSLQCNGISQIQATDARTDKVLGERVHETKPLKAEVTTNSDVAAWVQSGVRTVLQENGFSFTSGPTLLLSVDTLATKETIYHRSGYDASIAMTAHLQSASGKMCWTETIQGRGGNYGYSGSVQNYQQTLNEALANATVNMAQQQAFKDALCKCGN